MAKFTVYTDKHSEFRWKFTASNNVVVAKSGESYIRQEDCIASLSLLQKDIGGAPVGYQLRKGVFPARPAAASPAHLIASSPVVSATSAVVASPAAAASPAIAPVPPATPQN